MEVVRSSAKSVKSRIVNLDAEKEPFSSEGLFLPPSPKKI
jgi:hypothetical protein